MSSKKRDIWVDNVKVIACILVVLGHFFQSMVKSNLISSTFSYNLFEDTIYYFHVPLFFICSGYLYQKYSKVDSFDAWKNSVLKKFVVLGIPYFVFSIITWLLKRIFSSTVNTQLGGVGDTLFLHPTAPYWYLYVLFFIFLITFTTKNIQNQYILLTVSLVLKLVSVFGIGTGVYFIDKTFSDWIWFIFGMTIAYGRVRFLNLVGGILGFCIFVLGSYLSETGVLNFKLCRFMLAMLACYSVISVVYSLFSDREQHRTLAAFARYTMPVFLMHTLFAAPLRGILLKLGINSLSVHFVLGLVISFVGPIVAMIILEMVKPLDIIVYPNRYIKFKGEHNG